MKRLSLALILLTALGLAVSSPAEDLPTTEPVYMTLADFREARWHLLGRTNEIRRKKCRATLSFAHTAGYFERWQREGNLNYWRGKRDRALGLSSRCGPSWAIRHVFGSFGEQALAVAECESRLNVYATNGQYLGLFQMGTYARSRYGHSWTALGQSRAAYGYFVDSGRDWSPWQCRPWGLAW